MKTHQNLWVCTCGTLNVHQVNTIERCRSCGATPFVIEDDRVFKVPSGCAFTINEVRIKKFPTVVRAYCRACHKRASMTWEAIPKGCQCPGHMLVTFVPAGIVHVHHEESA